jgi:esterase/lipase superfamily enzyme
LRRHDRRADLARRLTSAGGTRTPPPPLQGDHLDWLRTSVSILVICGQGQWEDTTGALEGSKRFVASLAEKGLRHELDLWGHDVPHDWPSWRAQLAHHLPRFC